ncbi:MAG: hypothetical protein HY678_10195 [Chloroflexi bacterium]|nr:hypothetical protein [Chloroflexota bacterium]
MTFATVAILALAGCVGRGAVPTPSVPAPGISISRSQAVEIALSEVAKGWSISEGVQDPRDSLARLAPFPGDSQKPGGVMVAPSLVERYRNKLVWVVQVEGEALPSKDSPDRSGRAYYFHGVYIDPANGEVLARYASASSPLFYPASMRLEYSSDCVEADPADGLPPIGPASAIDQVRRTGDPPRILRTAGKSDFSRADANLISCSGPGSGGQKRGSLYWLVTVPAEPGLVHREPAIADRTEPWPTNRSGYRSLRMNGVDGSFGGEAVGGDAGPWLSPCELEQISRMANAEGWWKMWVLLRDYRDSRPPATFTFALAASDPKSCADDAMVTFELPALPRNPSPGSPREDPAYWAAQGSVAFVIVGRIVEQTGTFTCQNSETQERYALWRVDVENFVVGRYPGSKASEITVRVPEPGQGSRFPITLEPGAKAVLFMEIAPSFGDPARALDLAPAAIPGSNGVIKIHDDRVQIVRDQHAVEEPIEVFLDRVREIRRQSVGDMN